MTWCFAKLQLSSWPQLPKQAGDGNVPVEKWEWHTERRFMSMSEASCDDEQLLLRAQQGDEAAVDQLLRQFQTPLRNFAGQGIPKRLQRRIDASDILQDVWLATLKSLSQFKGETRGEFVNWLMSIKDHRILDIIRHHEAEKRNPARERRLESTSVGPLAGRSETPSRDLRRREKAEQLKRVVQNLPEAQAEAVRLRYFEHCGLSEIARRMSRTEAAVASLLKRGLKALEQKLDGEPSSH